MKNIKYLFLLLIASLTISVNGQEIKKIIALKESFRKDTVFSFSSGDTKTYLPVVVLKGKENGPVFSIVAGIHGYEYPPIVAMQELIKEVDINKLKGTLIIIPIANVASFYKRTPFINPIDQKNLNNAFPGSKTGTITDQLASFITTEVIANTNVFLDVHGGDANEDLLPFVCFYDRKDTPMQTAKAKELSEKSGFNHVVSYPYTLKATDVSKYAFKEATQRGITALSIEAGKLGNV
jgi:predicted deacylase